MIYSYLEPWDRIRLRLAELNPPRIQLTDVEFAIMADIDSPRADYWLGVLRGMYPQVYQRLLRQIDVTGQNNNVTYDQAYLSALEQTWFEEKDLTKPILAMCGFHQIDKNRNVRRLYEHTYDDFTALVLLRLTNQWSWPYDFTTSICKGMFQTLYYLVSHNYKFDLVDLIMSTRLQWFDSPWYERIIQGFCEFGYEESDLTYVDEEEADLARLFEHYPQLGYSSTWVT